jgi:hypothetical protein
MLWPSHRVDESGFFKVAGLTYTLCGPTMSEMFTRPLFGAIWFRCRLLFSCSIWSLDGGSFHVTISFSRMYLNAVLAAVWNKLLSHAHDSRFLIFILSTTPPDISFHLVPVWELSFLFDSNLQSRPSTGILQVTPNDVHSNLYFSVMLSLALTHAPL